LDKYYEYNRRYPERIIFYRDGVAADEVEMVKEFEISQIQTALDMIKDKKIG